MAVVEITSFLVREGSENDFAQALASAAPILKRQPGCVGHDYGASIERPDRFWLMAHWKTLEDHTQCFRESADFETFVSAFRPFLAEPATVSHFHSSVPGP